MPALYIRKEFLWTTPLGGSNKYTWKLLKWKKVGSQSYKSLVKTYYNGIRWNDIKMKKCFSSNCMMKLKTETIIVNIADQIPGTV